jgi:hypothetical protein
MRPAPLGSLEWLVALADLGPDDVPDFIAYMQQVQRGAAVEWRPSDAPYVLAQPEECP